MSDVFIAFGANLSNPIESFLESFRLMEAKGIVISKKSGLWQSPSWPPGQGHPDYLNGVLSVHWNGNAIELLEILQSVENQLGRVRTTKNAPRTLDLDILDFKGHTIDQDKITVPHPRMLTRGFVLFPLAQISPGWKDPHSGKAISEFIARLPLKDVEPMEYMGTI